MTYTIGARFFSAKPAPALKTLLISGSREATQPMLDFAGRCALRARPVVCAGWQIVVGDGYGVDAEVIRVCENWDIPYTCIGLNVRPRNGATMRHYERMVSLAATPSERYLERDRYLVRLAHYVICIGDSLTIYEYAQHLSRPAHLRSFEARELEWV